jgi:hypothetical protein
MNSSPVLKGKARRVVLSIPMSVELRIRTKRMAELEGRTPSNYVRWLISRDVNSRAPEVVFGDNEQGMGHQAEESP